MFCLLKKLHSATNPDTKDQKLEQQTNIQNIIFPEIFMQICLSQKRAHENKPKEEKKVATTIFGILTTN